MRILPSNSAFCHTDTSQSSFYSQGKEKFYENLAKQQEDERLDMEEEHDENKL
jgi:hypothetical protein